MKTLCYPADKETIEGLLDCTDDEPVQVLLEHGTECVLLSGERYQRLLDAELASRPSPPDA